MSTLDHLGNLFAFAGGLGMFLYGMNVMADGLQKTAGNKMRQLLGYLTNNRFLGVLVGALVTAIIQSSSATTVMVVGFVNAGIMNLTQAAGVIMGANVGTTITAWLVSANEWAGALKPEFFAPLILAIGAFIVTFSNKQKLNQKAEIAVGFGVLFIGLSFMSSSIGVYQSSPIFAKAFEVSRGESYFRNSCRSCRYCDHSEFFRIRGYSPDTCHEGHCKLALRRFYYAGAEYRYMYHGSFIQCGSK